MLAFIRKICKYLFTIMDYEEALPPFTIAIKHSGTRGLGNVSILLLALSYASFIYKYLVVFSPVELTIVSALTVASAIVYFGMRSGRWPEKYLYIIFVITGFAWFYQAGFGFAIGVMVIIAGILQTRINNPVVVSASNDGVAIKGVFTRHYEWSELNNVILKDGLLTVDCKNNRLFQKEVADNISAHYTAKFNEFCALKAQS